MLGKVEKYGCKPLLGGFLGFRVLVLGVGCLGFTVQRWFVEGACVCVRFDRILHERFWFGLRGLVLRLLCGVGAAGLVLKRRGSVLT